MLQFDVNWNNFYLHTFRRNDYVGPTSIISFIPKGRKMHVFQIAQFFRSTRDVCRNWSLYSSTRERSILPETAQLNVFNSWSMRRESTLFLECFVNNGWVRITLVLFAARRSFTSSTSMQVCSALKILKASNLLTNQQCARYTVQRLHVPPPQHCICTGYGHPVLIKDAGYIYI